MPPIFDDLPEAQRRLLWKIIRGRLAWTNVKRLEKAGHTTETLDELVAAGLAVRWQLPRILAATLTILGAEVCGVEIIERIREFGGELEEDPVWRRRPARWPALVLPNRLGEVRLPWMDAFPDPLPGPEVLIDEVTSEPMRMFVGETERENDDKPKLKGGLSSELAEKGFPVTVDKRLARKAAKANRKKSAKTRRKAG